MLGSAAHWSKNCGRGKGVNYIVAEHEFQMLLYLRFAEIVASHLLDTVQCACCICMCWVTLCCTIVPTMLRLNMRFTQTALPKASEETKSLWKSISQRGAREGKRHAQHRILTAFALDPSQGRQFCTAVQEMILKDSRIVDSTWMSKKELLDCYDESEAEELVESGYIVVRKHPRNPRRSQFKKLTERERVEMTKGQSFMLNDTHKVEGDQFMRPGSESPSHSAKNSAMVLMQSNVSSMLQKALRCCSSCCKATCCRETCSNIWF